MEEEKLQITYDNKIALSEQTDIPNQNKITAENMNEIKTVVNNISKDLNDVETVLNDLIQTTNLYSSNEFIENVNLNEQASKFNSFIVEINGNKYPENIKKKTFLMKNSNENCCFESLTWYNFSNKQIYVASPIFTLEDKVIKISNNIAGTVGASTSYQAEPNVVKITNVWGVNI